MRRAIVLALVLVLVPALPASAQSPAPASPWPTVDELRRDLQDIGYQFGVRRSGWEGGRNVLGEYAEADFSLIERPLGLVIMMFVEPYDALSGWPASTRSKTTALMEILSRLPAAPLTRLELPLFLSGKHKECRAFELPGGAITVDGTKGFDSAFSSYFVRVEAGSSGSCPESPPPTLAPAPTPTPVPTPIPTGLGTQIAISLQEWQLDPSELMLTAGTYAFSGTNDGSIDHALKIEGEGIEAQTPDTFYGPGVTESFTVDLTPGTYEIYCPVGGHKDAGMVARLTVR